MTSDTDPLIAGLTLSERNKRALNGRDLDVNNKYLYTKEVFDRFEKTNKNPVIFPAGYEDLVFFNITKLSTKEIEHKLVDLSGNSKPVMPLTEYLTRNVSTQLTKHIWIPSKLSATTVATLSFLSIAIGGLLFLPNTTPTNILALLLITLGFTLDCCDGEVARVKLQNNWYGAWLDSTYDRAGEIILILCLATTINNHLLGTICITGILMNHLTGAYVPQHLKNKHPTGGTKQGKIRIDWLDFGRSTQIFLIPLIPLINTTYGLLTLAILNHAYWTQRIIKYKGKQ